MKTVPFLARVLVLGLLCGTAMGAETNQTYQFSGKVLDAENHPLAGVLIERYESGPSRFFQPDDLVRKGETTTDAKGDFKLPLSGVQTVFLARKAGYALGWRQYWNPQNDITELQFVLTPPVATAGRVVDEKDKAVTGAQVSVLQVQTETTGSGRGKSYQYFFGNLARESFHSTTGADGQFRIENFPANSTLDLMARTPGKALRGGAISWKSGEQDIKLVMEPAAVIEGKVVVQDTDQPVPGARLWLVPDQQNPTATGQLEPAIAGADGLFRISDISSGSYRLQTIFGTNGTPEWVAEMVSVTAESGQTTRDVKVSATRGGLLEVVVIAKTDRKPVPDVSVSAYTENFQAGAMSGTNGLANVRLPAGTYQVSAYKNRWRTDNSTATIQAGQTNRIEVELESPTKVAGTVRRPDGQPATGLEVRIVGGWDPDGTVYPKTDGSGHFETEFDPRRYGRSDMRYSLLVRDPEHGLAVAQEIEEDGKRYDLKLAPGVTLGGRVQSTTGQPVTNVAAALLFRTGRGGFYMQDMAAKTNGPGRFDIPALPADGRYGVIISAPSYGQTTINEVSTESTNGRIELEPIELKVANLKLSGQVLDNEDKPVNGAYVNIYGEGQPNDNVRSDREGRFTFNQVCEGTVQVSANGRNSYGNVSAEGGDTNVVLRLGQNMMRGQMATARTVKGTVSMPDGKPAAGVRVSVFPSFNVESVRTDASGAFKVNWTPEPWQQGAACLVARDASHNLVTVLELEQDATTAELKLQTGGLVTGRVEDPDGKPLTKATVEVMFQFGRMGNSWGGEPVRVNGDGRFEVNGLAQGHRYQLYVSAPEYGRRHEDVDVEEAAAPKVALPPVVLRPANLLLAGKVVNAEEKPVSGAHVQIIGDDQPQVFITTDRQGRFKFKVCEGPVRLYVNQADNFSQATLEAGDTNAVISLTPRSRSARVETPRRKLEGTALPDLSSVGLAPNTLASGKPGLVCLLDFEQRPSRRFLRQLTDQYDALKEKGISVAAVQATVMNEEAWSSFKESNSPPFPIGRIKEQSPETRWATGLQSLPWLILVDPQGKVAAEGFGLDELDTKLETLSGK